MAKKPAGKQDLFGAVPLPEATSDTSDIERQAVIDALALSWTYRPRTSLLKLLQAMGARANGGSRAFNADDLRQHLDTLKTSGLLEEHPRSQGYWRLSEPERTAAYRRLLDHHDTEALRLALQQADNHNPSKGYGWPPYDQAAILAYVRLAFFSGQSEAAIAGFKARISYQYDWGQLLQDAVLDGFDPGLFARITPEWRWGLAYSVVANLITDWHPANLPLAGWANDCADRQGQAVPANLRLVLAELALHRGDAQRVRSLIGGIEDGFVLALNAALLVQEGRWQEGQLAFEQAFKRIKTDTGSRKRLLPFSLAWYYPLALLAQQTPQHVELARKHCLSEAGSRKPDPRSGWGLWVHAVGVRLGDVKLEPQALWPRLPSHGGMDELWPHLLGAWLGKETMQRGLKNTNKAVANARDHASLLHQYLQQCGFTWLDQQLTCAEAVLAGRQPQHVFFAAGGEEGWRTVLAALQALGDPAADTASAAKAAASRILWSLRLGKQGQVDGIDPLEQKQGVRGWSKPKPMSLTALVKKTALEPADAKVARTLRTARYDPRSHHFDLAAAIVTLIGHPSVVLDGAPEQTIDLVEGAPEMEVIRDGDQYSFRITPPIREAEERPAYYHDEAAGKEAEALRLITVVQDSPQRLRVIRLTPAQRRAAQLLSSAIKVPASEEAALRQTVAALSSHFQIQSDHEPESRAVAAESRLRGELSPVGEDLVLRLVVAPLGEQGPRLMPGAGRGRIFASVGGENLSAQRDLSAEQAHLEAVLDVLPFLDPPGRKDTVCEWRIVDPEQALEVVERLPALSAVAAVDWPKGKSLRVLSVDAQQLGLQVSTGRDWFHLAGTAQLDQGLVLKLEELLAWVGEGRGRFVPMGQGAYVALTERLREQLADLAAVVERGKDGLRVPHLAAAWLDEVLEGSGAELDAEFRQRIERLTTAQSEAYVVPHSLQAELRPYQEDGYVWASRLAAAGFGACLADDMGLGKTLQTLALLLARGGAGPALVVAPTSVCGNWLAETSRFAPALNCIVYGEGERETVVEQAGPMDVVIVSYTLLQQAGERFAARTWHTLVADEAQAVKNATTKRSQALFEVPADFRIALSGTPVENRLAELWSIMRFCNPGLLGTLPRFNERFAGPIERNRSREAQHLLRRLIAPFILRRTKAQVLQELPPRTELVLQVTADSAEAAHYEALRRVAVKAVEQAAASDQAGQARMNVLAQLTRLRRAACDPRLVSPELGIEGAKVQAFAQLAGELSANGHKTLVFSQFVDFLTLLRAPLDAVGIAYQYLDGATPAAERSRRVAAFQAGAGDLFLISLKAGGFGLNLTAADYVVIADPWWNPAAEDQAMGRAHRMGQQRPVTVYRLVNKGTLEESIVALHHEKRALAEGILADGEGAALPSTDDLIALIRGE